jgi:hypothetical protein
MRQRASSYYLLELVSIEVGTSVDTFVSLIVGTDVDVLIVSATE